MMESQSKSISDICENCETHGIVENGVVTLPCANCAANNGYEWNGRRCYGVCGIVDPNRGYIRESTLEELVSAHAYIVRPRLLEYNPPDLNGRTIDEYILDMIPDEGKNIYKEMI
jgi:hypothetical protein